MDNSEAYKLIGERAAEMAKNSKIQDEMMKQIKAGENKRTGRTMVIYVCC